MGGRGAGMSSGMSLNAASPPFVRPHGRKPASRQVRPHVGPVAQLPDHLPAAARHPSTGRPLLVELDVVAAFAARPARERMRALKPCVRARRRLLGW